jgi:hypothetical protein
VSPRATHHPLLNRYLSGEHEYVWQELGTSVLPSALLGEAQLIAVETMRRVRRNLELLVPRLRSEGFAFAHPLKPEGDDGWARYDAVRAQPSPHTEVLLKTVQQVAGPLPESVKAFYREVGAVNLNGTLEGILAKADDPLMVSPLEHFQDECDEWLSRTPQERASYPLPWEFAPDVLHKDDMSGGPPFRICLPAPGADGLVEEDMWGVLPFVAYLRIALGWAGFPGLRPREGNNRQEALVAKLTKDFERF